MPKPPDDRMWQIRFPASDAYPTYYRAKTLTAVREFCDRNYPDAMVEIEDITETHNAQARS